MRAFRLLLIFAALLGASPALADVTARYVATGDAGRATAVGADGAAPHPGGKLDPDLAHRGGWRGSHPGGRCNSDPAHPRGRRLIVRRDERGSYAARLEDYAAVSLEFFNRLMGNGEMRESLARIRFETRDSGPVMVGQWRGTLYCTSFPVAPDPPGTVPAGADESMQFVVSDDPSLRTLAPVAARAILTMTMMVGSFMLPDMTRAIRDVLARGAPLRLNRALSLQSVSDTPIAADRFAPPAELLTREQLRQRMPS